MIGWIKYLWECDFLGSQRFVPIKKKTGSRRKICQERKKKASGTRVKGTYKKLKMFLNVFSSFIDDRTFLLGILLFLAFLKPELFLCLAWNLCFNFKFTCALPGAMFLCNRFKSNTATQKNCFVASKNGLVTSGPLLPGSLPLHLRITGPGHISRLRGTWSFFCPDYLLWGRSLIKVPWSGKWWLCRWHLLFLAFLSSSVWRYISLEAGGRSRQAMRHPS